MRRRPRPLRRNARRLTRMNDGGGGTPDDREGPDRHARSGSGTTWHEGASEMSQSTAIGMVSESLRALLAGEMRLAPSVPVTVLAPDEAGGERRINLFLYKVQENASLKNLDWQVKRDSPNKVTPPPLSLNLFYLLTPYAANDPQTGNAVAHEILGEAMRVFYEHPVVPDAYLAAGLQDSREEIRIMLNT